MNILVVDDEYYTRKALSVCISDSFSTLGADEFQIHECDCAESALELTEQIIPDIVFTDIRMRETDGITLCECLCKRFPQVQTVIITGYAEFQYAQKAVEHHVFRYLLKPVDEAEIRSVVQELLLNYSLTTIPTGAQREDTEELTSISNLNLPDLPYMLLIFKAGKGNYSLNKERKEFTGKIRELGFHTIDLHSLSQSEYLVLLLFSSTQFEAESYRILEDFIKKTSRYLEELFGEAITSSFSGFHLNENELNTAYLEASQAAAPLSQTLKRIQNLSSREAYGTDFLDAISKKLISYYISNYKVEQARELIESFWDSLIHQEKITDDNCRHFLYEIVYQISGVLKKMEEINYNMISMDTHALRQLSTIGACKKYFQDFIGRLESQFSMQSDNQLTLVRQMIRYIDEHYSEDLNLYDIAQSSFFVHPNYLSKLLKDATGVSFSKYLLDVRMKNALQLLKRGDLSVSTVAQLTGYNSESYFVQVFRRYYGKTPGSYRKDM